jgi:predicted GNAT family N-acyltransferase
MKVEIAKVSDKESLEIVFAIRRKVFVEEQKCPPEIEWEFEEESTHFLALVDGKPVGAARWRKNEKGYKLERFAVLREFRGKGVGSALVSAVLGDLPKRADLVYLHAQTQAVKLYEKAGFAKEGVEFKEAGIRHYKMVLRR